MSDFVHLSAPALPPINEREVLRYMGAKQPTDEVLSLLRECTNEAEKCFANRICYRKFEIYVQENMLDLGFATVASAALAKNLAHCDCIVLFAATVGLDVDRLIAKYSRLSPARAVCLQAIGAERIEALCDAFCEDLREKYVAEGKGLRPRFSPGYGDLPLDLQTDIFQTLDCPRKIGLSLNDSLLMSPSKSVTAIVGIQKIDI